MIKITTIFVSQKPEVQTQNPDKMPKPKYNFALVEIKDLNKEFMYLGFISGTAEETPEEFLEKINLELEYNPTGENMSNITKHGRMFSITSRKTTMNPINARYVHYQTGRYGLIGFGRKVLFDQTKLIELAREDDERPRTFRATEVKIL